MKKMSDIMTNKDNFKKRVKKTLLEKELEKYEIATEVNPDELPPEIVVDRNGFKTLDNYTKEKE